MCFVIHTQPAPSPMVSTMEEPSDTFEVSKSIFSSG
jgi:hypothetical protein